MTPRRTLLLLTGAALLGTLVFRHATPPTTVRPRPALASAPVRPEPAIESAERKSSVVAVAPAGPPTRAAAVALVRALYRREQLTRELDLEQQRYGAHYWQAERSPRAIAQLQQAKAALLAQLAAEANQVLDELFPGQAGEPLAFAAIFDADHPGPQAADLPAALRARFEAEVLARGVDRDPCAERWLEIAEQILPAAEAETYRRWNEPAAAALRARLVGFAASEAEFGAILDATRANGGEPDSGVAAALETTLGAARFAEWQASQAPALRGALHDLQRLDLPLENAAWLATTRTSAIAAIQRTWQDATLADAAKARQVALLERVYGRMIATKFALPESSLDELSPAP